MRTLVVGANGLLGSNVFTAVRDHGGSPFGTYHTEKPPFEQPCYQLDIRNSESFCDLLDNTEPDHVVNCAAMTDVDGCEKRPRRAHEVNAEAPGTMARFCAERNLALTHVSTDYVFSGEGDTPYTIDSTAAPIQEYGRTKVAGEHAVQEYHPDSTIVRLSFVYGVHRGRDELEGFPAWVRSRLREAEPTALFTDQWVTPTRAGQAAEVILDLHEREATGLYHVASRSCVTPYEFGDLISQMVGVSPTYIEEGTMDDIDRPAERPSYTCLDVNSVESAIGNSQPTLREDFASIKSVFS